MVAKKFGSRDSRPCDLSRPFAYPPFGIAEWLSYSTLPTRLLKHNVIQQRIGLYFEQDLKATWQIWDCIKTHLHH
jgi:hypothetical protein